MFFVVNTLRLRPRDENSGWLAQGSSTRWRQSPARPPFPEERGVPTVRDEGNG